MPLSPLGEGPETHYRAVMGIRSPRGVGTACYEDYKPMFFMLMQVGTAGMGAVTVPGHPLPGNV